MIHQNVIIQKNFLINPNIILYYDFSLNIYESLNYHQHQYCYNQLKNHIHIHVVQFLFMLSTVKSIEILPKRNRYAFVLERFASN